MRGLRGLPVLLLLGVAGCSGSEAGEQLPGGTFAGSTSADAALVLEVGDEIKVNRREARMVDRGVLELEEGGVLTRLTCTVSDPEGEELRCELRTLPPGGKPTTEVIDLMLL